MEVSESEEEKRMDPRKGRVREHDREERRKNSQGKKKGREGRKLKEAGRSN